ncbi:hypothetical protein BH18THE1_BH18THE1_15140 [soil metagenome]
MENITLSQLLTSKLIDLNDRNYLQIEATSLIWLIQPNTVI